MRLFASSPVIRGPNMNPSFVLNPRRLYSNRDCTVLYTIHRSDFLVFVIVTPRLRASFSQFFFGPCVVMLPYGEIHKIGLDIYIISIKILL